jgi:predicted Zn-dependent protease
MRLTNRKRLGLMLVIVGGLAAAALAVAAVRFWSGSDPDRLFHQSRAELQAGHLERAEALLRRLERVRPPNEFDRLLRAQVADARHRPDEAVAELSRIADTHPLAPVARLLTGQNEVKRNRLRAAEAAFLATIALEPNSDRPRRELVYIYDLQHRQAELDAQLHALSEIGLLSYAYVVQWGKTRNVVWKPDQDCVTLAACLEADPDDRDSRLALSEGLQRLNRLPEALKILAPLPDTDPDACARRADLAITRGDFAEADRLLSVGPADHPRLGLIRGRLALHRGDARTAVRELNLAYMSDPTDGRVLHNLENALRMAGDEAATAKFAAAARRHDAITPLISRASTDEGAKSPALPALLGAACEAAGRLYEARAWYKLAILRDPLDRESQQAVFRTGRAIAERAAAATHPAPESSNPKGPTG